MAFVSLWTHGAMECMLAIFHDRQTIRLVDDSGTLREEIVTCSAEMSRWSTIFEIEAHRRAQRQFNGPTRADREFLHPILDGARQAVAV
jgi:hypothetical protein